MYAVIVGRNQVHGQQAAHRAAQMRRQSHPANRSRIVTPPPQMRAVGQSLAATEAEDLGRLQAVLEDAQSTNASADEVAARVEEEIPTASFLAPLLRDAGTPLATWLAVLLGLIGLILMYRQQEQPEPVITPEQVEEIITRVVDELNADPPAEPAGGEPKAKQESKSKAMTPKKREP